MFADPGQWTDKRASELLSQYICTGSNGKNRALEQEILHTVAQILGMVVDLLVKPPCQMMNSKIN